MKMVTFKWVTIFIFAQLVLFSECGYSNENFKTTNFQKEHVVTIKPEELKIKIDKELADKLRNNKFYARGQSNVGCEGDVVCDPEMQWGPAKDISYFLYDREPYIEDEILAVTKRRTKRKDEVDKEKDPEHTNDQDDADDEEDDHATCHMSLNKKEESRGRRHCWDSWGPWGPCSSTCGPGTKSRWRHCLSETCPKGEREAQVQPCIMIPC